MNNLLKMDGKLIIIIAIVITFILGLLVGRVTSDRYYFMKASDSDIAVYRCDRITGDVELRAYIGGSTRIIKLE